MSKSRCFNSRHLLQFEGFNQTGRLCETVRGLPDAMRMRKLISTSSERTGTFILMLNANEGQMF